MSVPIPICDPNQTFDLQGEPTTHRLLEPAQDRPPNPSPQLLKPAHFPHSLPSPSLLKHHQLAMATSSPFSGFKTPACVWLATLRLLLTLSTESVLWAVKPLRLPTFAS